MKRFMTKPSLTSLVSLFGCCLVILLSACNFQAGLNADALAATKNTSSPQTVPMPPTQTSCPADGTARAAVFRPLSLGGHQNLVYIYNEMPPNASTSDGQLKRYDVTTGKKTLIAVSGLSISNAQVSADGQWILFLSQIDPRGDRNHSSAIQLVRMDGQGLQTLYCFSNKVNANSVQWSTDQKSILFGDNTPFPTTPAFSTIRLLDVATGKLHTELQVTDPLYGYRLRTWLDNTRAYVERLGLEGPPPPITLYLLDTRNNPTTNGSSLKKLFDHAIRFSYLSYDSSYDAKTLYVSYCLTAFNPFDTTIWSEPATGGAQHIIYRQSPTICAEQLRVISSRTLFIVGQRVVNQNQNQPYVTQVWTLNTDGSNRKVLFETNISATYSVSPFSQFPWSTISRDGKSYTLQTVDPNNNEFSTVVIGSLSGGSPKTIAYTARGSVLSVGWTTM